MIRSCSRSQDQWTRIERNKLASHKANLGGSTPLTVNVHGDVVSVFGFALVPALGHVVCESLVSQPRADSFVPSELQLQLPIHRNAVNVRPWVEVSGFVFCNYLTSDFWANFVNTQEMGKVDAA